MLVSVIAQTVFKLLSKDTRLMLVSVIAQIVFRIRPFLGWSRKFLHSLMIHFNDFNCGFVLYGLSNQ